MASVREAEMPASAHSPHPNSDLSISLQGTGIETTRLAFGCARLFRVPSSPLRQRLLGAAFDAGIRHFDVARMYGLGVAEAELGSFARGRRDQVVIATKFGIETGALRRAAPIQSVGRRLLGLHPQLRRLARAAAATGETRGYDPISAARSLEASLKALDTDYVDLLMLHEPGGTDHVDPAIVEFLEAKRQNGVIRSWGISGNLHETLKVFGELPIAAPVLQIRIDDPGWSGWSAPPNFGRIAFGVVEQALAKMERSVLSDPAKLRRWSEALGRSLTSEYTVSLLIATAQHTVGGPVLYSTTQERRLANATAALNDREVCESVGAFRALWLNEFPEHRDEPHEVPCAN